MWSGIPELFWQGSPISVSSFPLVENGSYCMLGPQKSIAYMVVLMAFHEDSAAVGFMLWSMCVYSGSVFNVILKAALIWKVNLPSKQSKSLNSVLWSIWVFVLHQLNISQVFSKHLCNHRILTNEYSSLSLCVQQIWM